MVPFPCSLERHNLCGRWRRSGSTQYRCPWPVRVIRAQVCRSAGVGTSSSFDDAVRGTLGNKRPYFLCRRRFASIDWDCCQQITPPLDARSMLLKAPLPSIGRINICSAGVPFGRNQLQAQTRAGPFDAPNTSILDFFSNSWGRPATQSLIPCAIAKVQLPKFRPPDPKSEKTGAHLHLKAKRRSARGRDHLLRTHVEVRGVDLSRIDLYSDLLTISTLGWPGKAPRARTFVVETIGANPGRAFPPMRRLPPHEPDANANCPALKLPRRAAIAVAAAQRISIRCSGGAAAVACETVRVFWRCKADVAMSRGGPARPL